MLGPRAVVYDTSLWQQRLRAPKTVIDLALCLALNALARSTHATWGPVTGAARKQIDRSPWRQPRRLGGLMGESVLYGDELD
ncbi:hypothetical protein PUNSTDRAFT_48604 [Punctularia strigosozonata HHB-11173 SS5]|uniref:uncharacterized protein n=1 Tax=Punctularia strigosozonata (strain HHB-11173) TaxID=741275 RepID=UPI000441647D|nr:uncharacterized protein PUNSTDRAFT_48604 [Punctularia strigosozonata HHB-11173 SS5]EIN13656.1 hypothetical protein PUNSTDRAFT_48604 [Punctularia strigosozonata HHB-11173 SS5]